MKIAFIIAHGIPALFAEYKNETSVPRKELAAGRMLGNER